MLNVNVKYKRKCSMLYGPFYRIGAKSGWKYFENLYVLFPKLCPYIYCTISKVHISSK